MKVWQEHRWPYQWIGECDGARTVNKNHASIRCNCEEDAIEFMTTNECCPAIDAETAKAIKFEKDRLHKEVAEFQRVADNDAALVRRLYERIDGYRVMLTNEAKKSSCLFAEAVAHKKIAIDATNAGARIIQERDAARAEILNLKRQILSDEIDKAQDKVDAAVKLAQSVEREWFPFVTGIRPAPQDREWLKHTRP